MYKIITSTIAILLLSSCASTTNSFQTKVENRVKEKTTNKVLTKVGLGSIVKPQKTTTQKLIDVSKGKDTIENVAIDIAVDKTADSVINRVL